MFIPSPVLMWISIHLFFLCHPVVLPHTLLPKWCAVSVSVSWTRKHRCRCKGKIQSQRSLKAVPPSKRINHPATLPRPETGTSTFGERLRKQAYVSSSWWISGLGSRGLTLRSSVHPYDAETAPDTSRHYCIRQLSMWSTPCWRHRPVHRGSGKEAKGSKEREEHKCQKLFLEIDNEPPLLFAKASNSGFLFWPTVERIFIDHKECLCL